VPSLSKIIRYAGLEPDLSHIPKRILDRKKRIGEVVHDALEAVMLGFEIEDVPKEAEGYIHSAMTVTYPFPLECVLRPPNGWLPTIIVEQAYLGRVLGVEYGCRIDLIVGRPYYDGPQAIVEWKTSTKIHQPAVTAQMGGQMLATGLDVPDLIVHRLDKAGGPPESVGIIRDEAKKLFEAAVTIYAAKVAHEPKKRGADNA
jgi:hypothetical protein